MSLYLTMAYAVNKTQAAAAVTNATLNLRQSKYVFDLGQGPLGDALTTYAEDIQAELGNELDIDVELDDFGTARGRHDPARALAVIAALRAALDAGRDLIVTWIDADWRSPGLMRTQLADFETFCQFGIAHGLQFSHTFG